MDPATIAVSLEALSAVAQAIQQAQAGQMTPEQLAAVWTQQASRCQQANAAWTAAGQKPAA